ncbi:polysaccharide biosynthesis/export family protein [Devosia algicola]|uniref:Polysaccharide biosynthesis/export family protein n=1 Tax=Devosia algicola TaxID=3026418 RepID=A0ABY7YQJ8_9HYPH|nr:polysaccharide biosynthesis/export family protein [Devosia algicola]WDR03529.1 polysaccharide biosynthesis/export family protein [Devosia algicola]
MLGDRIRTRRAVVHAGWIGLTLLLLGGSVAGEPYLLSISDKITVKVVEWQAGESKFIEQTALSGDYVIGADGNASFPFVGAEQGAGKSATELATTLSVALQQELGLPTAPMSPSKSPLMARFTSAATLTRRENIHSPPE